jgi:hypothetical protein
MEISWPFGESNYFFLVKSIPPQRVVTPTPHYLFLTMDNCSGGDKIQPEAAQTTFQS